MTPYAALIGDAGLAFANGGVDDLRWFQSGLFLYCQPAENAHAPSRGRAEVEFNWDRIVNQGPNSYDELLRG